ncbi:DEAD/DEAH box helicase [Aliihoeflea sp. 40Bstr573]|uniref:SNF2-related protein n=1 Tax=Aliihoeflea sp. 40Bstr573 TaxID=2696467 RepID=UPI0020945EFB|nr:DEAD/DEAH box helicase [Aliihoeflea sp. 40Bstr573]MCO6388250.1 ATP-dependent helicase [Aliihoeflea sp. 40Bstr573]
MRGLNEAEVFIRYDRDQQRGTLSIDAASAQTSLWDRLRQSSLGLTEDYALQQDSISLPWPSVLALVREYAPAQKRLGFRFRPLDEAKTRIEEFLVQYRAARAAQKTEPQKLSAAEIEERLRELGFKRDRPLRDFQIRDLQRLLSLPNGANFSVPGAGKTTVTFALHLLTRQPEDHILVVGPKSAFPAWSEVIGECIGPDAPDWVTEPFTVLTGGADAIRRLLTSGKRRFVINYEQLINVQDTITSYLLQNPVHLVLDESHRMKGGLAVKRGAALLNVASLPKRRDILSGTPMPQSPSDMQSQLDFLWPGVGLGLRIAGGTPPKEVIGNLYVRTTKADLGLPPAKRHFIQSEMGRGQAALYAITRDETLRNLSSLRTGSGVDIVRARRSVMRLLQLSANPVLALRGIMEDAPSVHSGIVQQVLEDGPSPKMCDVQELARRLAAEGRKTVIWTIFTDTIEQMARMLAELNPVTVYGAIPSGDVSDPQTREGKIQRFKTDPSCMVFIANPAAAGEGISLHHVCHDAIYLDRSYNSTHFLQSIDRIHRLGLPPGTETNIHIFQTKAPMGLGCVDHSVSRRLRTKLRALQQLLDDEDLHRIALDEENADEPIDYDINPDDLVDLIEELEGRAVYSEEEGE